MKTCPPAGAGILNITGSVTFAPVGDQVMSCGLGATRCWFGTVAGKTGKTVKSTHFTPIAFEHEDYILV